MKHPARLADHLKQRRREGCGDEKAKERVTNGPPAERFTPAGAVANGHELARLGRRRSKVDSLSCADRLARCRDVERLTANVL